MMVSGVSPDFFQQPFHGESSMKIGILSDTHITTPSSYFRQQVNLCFGQCQVIFHAGDLVDVSILEAFGDKEVHAVHGNMCLPSSARSLPRETVVEVDGYRFGLTHGREYRTNVEENLVHHFDQVDCIISGHTHRPVCHTLFDILFVNPGSFTGTGRYGAPGTFAILDTTGELTGRIYEVPRL